jgi:hypothetical protein
MSSEQDLVLAALRNLPTKPSDTAAQKHKKRYSEQMSAAFAQAFAEALRQRGLIGTRPSPPGEVGASGAERRMAGAIGAKKVDVTWATDESGLLLALSIKTINFSDAKTKNYQKNLTNRRNDMLYEAVTLHRRFPYAVLGGFFVLDEGAASDLTETRHSTYKNAHSRLKLFTGRTDPDGREEQYERLYIGLVNANSFSPSMRMTQAGKPDVDVPVEGAITDLLRVLVERNGDFYDWDESGRLLVLGRPRRNKE